MRGVPMSPTARSFGSVVTGALAAIVLALAVPGAAWAVTSPAVMMHGGMAVTASTHIPPTAVAAASTRFSGGTPRLTIKPSCYISGSTVRFHIDMSQATPGRAFTLYWGPLKYHSF